MRSYNYDYNYFLDYRLTDYRTDRSIIMNESEDLYNLSLIKNMIIFYQFFQK